MSRIDDFMNRVAGDPALGSRLVQMSSADDIVALGRELGIELSVSDVAATLESPEEISDSQLENVVGGAQSLEPGTFTFGGRLAAKTKIEKTTCGDTRCHTDSCSGNDGITSSKL